MSISVVKIDSSEFLSIHVRGKEDIALVQLLISRGISTWDRAPAAIKIAADEIRYGEPLQNYKEQEHTKPRPE